MITKLLIYGIKFWKEDFYSNLSHYEFNFKQKIYTLLVYKSTLDFQSWNHLWNQFLKSRDLHLMLKFQPHKI